LGDPSKYSGAYQESGREFKVVTNLKVGKLGMLGEGDVECVGVVKVIKEGGEGDFGLFDFT
jgi:hypothetical protein